MPVSKVASAAVFALILGGTCANAQVLGSAQPAEFPPTSYTGKQYVDSKGCVYIRAGVAGNVTWVPRVTRSREPICGMQPTLGNAAQPAAPTNKVAQAPAPEPAAAPKPKPEPAAAPTKRKAAAPVRQASVPKRMAPARVAAPQVTGNCTNLGASSQYMQGEGLRCGPQAESPVSYGSGSGGTVAGYAPGQAAVAVDSGQRPVSIPKGYRPVWKDDRLNPNRGPRTAAGQASMDLVWTQTVPRRLIDRKTGQDVTRQYQHLNPPQMAAAPRPAAQGGRYVQVGTFGQSANAQRTAAQLQRSGLPVRTARYAKGGRNYQIVMAGPFASAADLNAALATARRAGFGDAFIR